MGVAERVMATITRLAYRVFEPRAEGSLWTDGRRYGRWRLSSTPRLLVSVPAISTGAPRRSSLTAGPERMGSVAAPFAGSYVPLID
jgi:hypothetical protein